MMKEFNQLDIDEAAINLVDVSPLKKIDLKVFTPEGKEYFITFFQVAGFQLNLQTYPYGKVISHDILSNSIFLEQIVGQSSEVKTDSLIHYNIKLSNGFIDVVSVGFTYSLIWDAV